MQIGATETEHRVLERNIAARSYFPRSTFLELLGTRSPTAIRRKYKHLWRKSARSSVYKLDKYKTGTNTEADKAIKLYQQPNSFSCRKKVGLAFTDCYAPPDKIMAGIAGKGEGS